MIEIHFEVWPPVGRRQHYQLFADDDNLSSALEVINQFVWEGYDLQWVYSLDEGVPVSLPITSFDGQPIGVPVRC